jgi:hypothetical protein
MTSTGQARNAFPAFRVFIFGQEVTEDVLSISVNWTDGRQPNTAEVVLVNKLDRYVITEGDIHALYDDVAISQLVMPDLEPVVLGTVGAPSFAQSGRTPDALDQVLEARLNEFQRDQKVVENVQRAKNFFDIGTATLANQITREIRDRLDHAIRDVIKQGVLDVKIGVRVQIEQPDVMDLRAVSVAGSVVSASSARDVAELRGEAARYPFQVGDCIFHSNDPIRIFWRDPFNAERWFHMFAGFVTDWVDEVEVNGEARITIRCEDVTRILRYGRITTNPGIFDVEAVQQVEDFVMRTFFNDHGFRNLTLPELLFTMLFGVETAGTQALVQASTADGQKTLAGDGTIKYVRYAANGGSSIDYIPKDGAGAFNFDRSVTFIFGLDADASANQRAQTPQQLSQRTAFISDLAVYQAVVDHEVKVTDLETMSHRIAGGIPRSAVEDFVGAPQVSQIIKAIGENPHLYPVDGGRLVILAPASLGPNANRDILLRDLIQSIATETTFSSRLQVIYDILDRIEFSFYASPKGDILCEMPLYDFDPDDFGDAPVSRSDLQEHITFQSADEKLAPRDISNSIDEGDERGPFGPFLRVARRDTISWQRTFSDEQIRTQFVTTWHNFSGYTTTGTATTIGQQPQVTTLRAMVPAFGVRVETAEPTGFIASPEAAKAYCELKLNQWNSNARTAAYNILPTLRMTPNRPVLFAARQQVASIRSVTHTIDWPSRSMTTGVDVNYIRGWDGGLREDNGKPNYAPIGGEASRPLNYARLFKKKSVGASQKTRGGAP